MKLQIKKKDRKKEPFAGLFILDPADFIVIQQCLSKSKKKAAIQAMISLDVQCHYMTKRPKNVEKSLNEALKKFRSFILKQEIDPDEFAKENYCTAGRKAYWR